MVILLHVLVALISVIQTTFLLFAPSKTKLYITYALFGSTLVSGTYLLITMPAHMVQTCIEGIVYMGFVIWSIVAASKKLEIKTTTD